MPSPFPGMDPYLESPALWPGVHSRLINDLSDLLVPQVKPRYIVDVERRVFVLGEDDPAQRQFVPDVSVIDAGASGATEPASLDVSRATAVVLMVMGETEVSEPRLVIREAMSRALVTVIELLSPTNKTPGFRGREDYLSKRKEVLRSKVHLIEVDLLRAGGRIPSAEALPRGDYLAHVSRVSMRPRGEVFAWTVRDRAPILPVPLGPDDRDAKLDIGAALGRTYERGGYDLVIDYTRPPEPPPSEADARWAAEALRSRAAGP